MGTTIIQDWTSLFRIHTAVKWGIILRNQMSNFPWHCAESPSELCLNSNNGKTAKEPHPSLHSEISSKCKIPSLSGQPVNKLQQAKNESLLFRLCRHFCRDIIHYSVGVCVALSQRWAGAVTVTGLWAANQWNAKQRLNTNSLLLTGYGLALDRAGTWCRNSQYSPSFISILWITHISHANKFKLVTSFMFRLVSLLHISTKADVSGVQCQLGGQDYN